MTELSLNDVNLSRAVEFFKQGQLDDAQTCLLSVLQAAPANPDALYFMSMIDFRAGRTAVAENRACELVYVMPEDGKALNLLGNIQMNLGKFDEANQTYARGMKSDPTNSTIWVNAAICFLGQGKPERSLELSREAASLEPDSSNAHNVMGSAYLAINQLADAKKCFEMALSVSPGDIDAKFNLGKVQLDMGSRDAAIEIFDQILMENPLHLQALTRKGDALSSARQFQDAESCYRKALETEPSFLIAYIGYGKLLLSVAKPNEALERLKKALDIDPTCIEALMLVGKAFQMLDQTDGAAAAFRDVLSIDPSNYDAEFMLASVEGTGAPAKPDGSYVRRLFDDFADSFDDSLNQVGYDAPQQLLKMAETQLGESVGNGFDVIDLGCGTGLVGLEFKKFARNMKGIDISPRMLEEARGRGVYDELETNELLAALVRHHNDTDIVVSADVFPYIGDLESIFLAVTSALRKNGLFLFTVEAHSGDEDYRLSSKARYSHTKEYISMLAQRRGLTIVDCDDSSYRKEGGEPVSGLVVALKKSA